MPIPDYQSLMLPVLKLAADGEIHVRDAANRLAIELALTPEERAMMLPSGRQTLLSNRLHWAKSYMLKAGLVRSPRRGYFAITDRGREVLSARPPRIDNDLLMRFEEFRDFIEKSRSPESHDRSPDQPSGDRAAVAAQATPVAAAEETPDEAIRSAVRAIGRSGDGGLDGVIDEDALGLDRVYVQAKRHAPDNPVGEPEIRGFAGSLGAAKANKGVFVTTSRFTRSAHDFVVRTPNKIVLIDGDMLATLMIRYGVGVRTEQTILVKKIDEDFFLDE